MNLESGQASDAVRRIQASGCLDSGRSAYAHRHIRAGAPQLTAPQRAKLARFANELLVEHSLKLQFIDIGGGFASPNSLKGQYLGGEHASPSFSRYADAVAQGLLALDCIHPRNGPCSKY